MKFWVHIRTSDVSVLRISCDDLRIAHEMARARGGEVRSSTGALIDDPRAVIDTVSRRLDVRVHHGAPWPS